jgi:hypothetical protein
VHREAAFLSLAVDAVAIEATAVIAHLDGDRPALVLGRQGDRPDRRLALGEALLGGLDAMVDRVAQQVDERVADELRDVTTGGVSFTTPNIAGFTFSAYIGTTTSPSNLGLCTGGPTSGPMTGQAVQLPANTAVVLTGIGMAQTPPAAPASGVTVYPTFVFGQEYFACLQLEDISFTFLGDADKSDPLNQLRIIGWKDFQGYVILNQQFGARIESSVSNTGTFG